MEDQEVTARPLLGYAFIVNPNHPEIVIIEVRTKTGPSRFVATRKILEELGDALHAQASKMSLKQDTQYDDDSFTF
jgi:hypothetical protein